MLTQWRTDTIPLIGGYVRPEKRVGFVGLGFRDGGLIQLGHFIRFLRAGDFRHPLLYRAQILGRNRRLAAGQQDQTGRYADEYSHGYYSKVLFALTKARRHEC